MESQANRGFQTNSPRRENPQPAVYYTFPLSYRDVEKMMLERRIFVTYEAIRKWCRKFGQKYANQIRHHRPQPSDKWHLDEVVLTIEEQKYYLWRAVDSEGNVLEILMQSRRNTLIGEKVFPETVEETELCATSDCDG